MVQQWQLFHNLHQCVIFTVDTNIFNIFLYSILSRCFATYSVITGYLMTSFSHIFGSKSTVIVIAKYYMIECSSTVLLIHAVEPGASEVICEAWFYVAA